MKQRTNTYRNLFSRSYENRSIRMRIKKSFSYHSFAFSLALKERLRAILEMAYLSVSIFSTQVPIENLEMGPPFLRGLPSHTTGKLIAKQRQYLLPLLFKTLSIGPVPRIELATSCSTGQQFTD